MEPLALPTFAELGFERRICTVSGDPFWSADPQRTTSGDTIEDPYTFLGAPPVARPYTLASMREAFLGFFEQRHHTRVPRYPVVARWRSDVFLVNASIYDFQPHVTSGAVPPPANPLVISQPCIRLTDLSSVGRSGRHTSNFEMMAHHAFNRDGAEVYWRDQTLRYCHEFLRSLGVTDTAVTYKENPWFGGGNAGAALEVIIHGLEVATLVFMDLAARPDGPVIISGERYGPMPVRVVDTGYGLERLLWMSTGTPTIYDSLYPQVLSRLYDLGGITTPTEIEARHPGLFARTSSLAGMMAVDTGARLSDLRQRVHAHLVQQGSTLTLEHLRALMEPVEEVAAIADHSRCLALLLGDDVVPSNGKVGYLARLVLRRTLRLLDRRGIDLPLIELLQLHGHDLEGIVDFHGKTEQFAAILALETERYREASRRGEGLVARLVAKHRGTGALPPQELVELYDSHGLHPEVVAELVAKAGLQVSVPDDFHAAVAARHERTAGAELGADVQVAAEQALITSVRATLAGEPLVTLPLYYEDVHATRFDAVVVATGPQWVILDQTLFYPEGGGQPADHGRLHCGAIVLPVIDVQKVDGAIVHVLAEGSAPPRVGSALRGEIDPKRRTGHLRHHTATHIVLGAARKVLGDHVWQAGAQKEATRARLDITHYDRLSLQQRQAIEQVANAVVLAATPIEKLVLPRAEAEARFGFRLYQGGAPAATRLRVLHIGDHDTQGCGGTHADNSAEVGLIKLLKADRIADGVVRLEYAAGEAAIAVVQHQEAVLTAAATAMAVAPDSLTPTIERTLEEVRRLGKELARIESAAAAASAWGALDGAPLVGSVRLICRSERGTATELLRIATELLRSGSVVAALMGEGGDVLLARSEGVDIDCASLLRSVLASVGGRGGGKGDLAQGRVPAPATGPTLVALEASVRAALAGAPAAKR